MNIIIVWIVFFIAAAAFVIFAYFSYCGTKAVVAEYDRETNRMWKELLERERREHTPFIDDFR